MRPSPPTRNQRCLNDGSSLIPYSRFSCRLPESEIGIYSLILDTGLSSLITSSAELFQSISFYRTLSFVINVWAPVFVFQLLISNVLDLRPTIAADLALQQLERYRTPLVTTYLGSANVDVALPELFQVRRKARVLVFMKRDRRVDKPRFSQ
jgi:hypothetical protein